MAKWRHSTVKTPTDQVRVFINYRRADTKHVAGRLRDLIVARFGEDSVFVDVEDIEPGADYVSTIDQAVSGCGVMLVLIGDLWLTAVDGQGQRRIDDPGDRLRLEIEAGLRHSTRVIPVLVDSASMPKTRDLPQQLVSLSRHHAIRLDHDSFRQDTQHLLEVIQRIFAGDTAPVPPTPTPRKTPPTHAQRPPSSSPTSEPDDVRRAARRWALGLLVAVPLTMVLLTPYLQPIVDDSRPRIPDGGLWSGLVWLLPALPVVVAAWLVATRKAPGVAMGCLAGAALWLITQLLVSEDGDLGGGPAQLFVLALMVGAAIAVSIAEPQLRARVRPNSWSRALVALLLLLAAILLRVFSGRIARVLTGEEVNPLVWSKLVDGSAFWISVLIPLLVCLPAALLWCNKVQGQALRTAALLQIVYPLVLRTLVFPKASDDARSLELVGDLVFLTGCLCIVLAVLAGQRGSVGGARSARSRDARVQ